MSPDGIVQMLAGEIKQMAKHTPWEQRFWPKVNKTAGCWLWTATTNSYGYGQFFKAHHRPTLAHRLAWELVNGQLPKGACLLHRCDVRLCVNPAHLFIGTRSENTLDRHAKGRTAKGEGHGMTRLTADDVRAMRSTFNPGERYSAARLMLQYGIGISSFYSIIRRETWKDVG